MLRGGSFQYTFRSKNFGQKILVNNQREVRRRMIRMVICNLTIGSSL